jgi:hypothetical protein
MDKKSGLKDSISHCLELQRASGGPADIDMHDIVLKCSCQNKQKVITLQRSVR